jgi:hypothetical protein
MKVSVNGHNGNIELTEVERLRWFITRGVGRWTAGSQWNENLLDKY